MDDRVLQLRVGILVLVTALITFVLVVYFSGQLIFGHGHYVVHIEFSEAPGVSVGTPVRKSGILIGRVNKVSLQDDSVTVSVGIKKNYRISKSDIARISAANLFGDAVVEFVRHETLQPQPDQIRHGDFLRGEVAGDPLSVLFELQAVIVDLKDDAQYALRSVGGASNEVGKLAHNLNVVVGDDGGQLGSLLRNSDRALQRVDEAARVFTQIFGDKNIQADLRNALQEIPQILSQASTTLAGIQRMTSAVEKNLNHLEILTKSLGDRGPAILDRIDEDVQLLDVVLNELIKIGESVSDEKGTIGKLLQDAELYDRLNRTARNVEDISRQLRPLVHDMRVFSSKIARDPGQLGVRGVLDRRQSGLKGTAPWRGNSDFPGR